MSTMGERVRKYLDQTGTTRAAFAELSGLSQSRLYKILRSSSNDGLRQDAIEMVESVLNSKAPSVSERNPPRSLGEKNKAGSTFIEDMQRMDPNMDVMGVVRVIRSTGRKKNITLKQFIALCLAAHGLDKADLNFERMFGRQGKTGPGKRGRKS